MLITKSILSVLLMMVAQSCGGFKAARCVKVNRSRCGAKKQHKIKCKIDSHLNELCGVCERL